MVGYRRKAFHLVNKNIIIKFVIIKSKFKRKIFSKMPDPNN